MSLYPSVNEYSDSVNASKNLVQWLLRLCTVHMHFRRCFFRCNILEVLAFLFKIPLPMSNPRSRTSCNAGYQIVQECMDLSANFCIKFLNDSNFIFVHM